MKRFFKSFLALALAAMLALAGTGCCVTSPADVTSAEESAGSVADVGNSSADSSFTPEASQSESQGEPSQAPENESSDGATENKPFDIASVPEYSGEPYVVINDNQPNFSQSELTTKSYEFYSNLDSLGRCGVVIASVGRDIMPTEDRGEIGMVKPTGWHTVKYDVVNGKYLYNRCHLIGFQLTGENANTKNLITGTRYLNVEGMLPFENMIADYVKETGNHVAYRVTPIFAGNNLLASGVQMEAYSIEDNGDGICFNVYCYNVQPQIEIDYATGESRLAADTPEQSDDPVEKTTYVLNTKSKKFHKSSCSRLPTTNREDTTLSREEIIALGYDPCGFCHP